MCDEETEVENKAYLEKNRVSRREANLGFGAVAVGLLAGCGSQAVANEPQAPENTAEPKEGSKPTSQDHPEAVEVVGRMVSIDTGEGEAEAYFVAPHEGKHAGVLMWPDVAGLREAFQTMAQRLAGEGYAVLVVNPYYRSSKMPVLTTFSEWKTEEGKAKIAPMRAALTPEAISNDAAAYVAWVDQQAEVDSSKKLASSGYCMGGPFTFRTAAVAADRVGAFASFHGGGLVAEEADSPHLLFDKMQARGLICIARSDDERSPEDKTTLQQAARDADCSVEIEVYPAQHGFCVIDSPVYEHEQAERAWARMLANFKQSLSADT